MIKNYLVKGLDELGLVSLWSSTRDVKCLCLQRFVRLFGYGGSALILVAYLSELGISKERIGLFMTLTLIGDTCISFFLTLFADAMGRKVVLALGAAMMCISGIVFSLTGNYWLLLVAAIFGVISPNGIEIGPFRAIEESILAHLTPSSNQKRDIYAWYSLSGTSGAAFGSLAAGWLESFLKSRLHWNSTKAYRAVFNGYAMIGLFIFLLAVALSDRIEAGQIVAPIEEDPETAALLGDGAEEAEPKKSSFRSLLPNISAESRPILVKVCVLFALDNFAFGLVPSSWVTYFFHDKFNVDDGILGSLFFTTNIITAGSILVASSLAKRFGNIKTMVFTHLPSSIFLSLIPVPNTVQPAMLFLILRSCTVSMDNAPRSAFLASIFLPHERTAVLGTINVAKSLSQSMGPLVTGILAKYKLFWIAFVAAGSLKITYDFGLLAVFGGHKTYEDRAEEERQADEEGTVR